MAHSLVSPVRETSLQHCSCCIKTKDFPLVCKDESQSICSGSGLCVMSQIVEPVILENV